MYAALDVAAVTDLATGGIHDTLAPKGTALPHVIFQQVAGGDLNRTPRRSRNPLYMIKAIAYSKAEAAAILLQVDIALHDQSLAVGDGWTCYRLKRETDVPSYSETEQDTERIIWHKGGNYRVEITRT